MGNFQNMEQVIINLIQNACQAMENPGNGIFITITYDRSAREIVVSVKDEGIGIPEKDLKYISEPFFTSKRSSGGTGLGLYMSSKIVSDHGGTIHFLSAPGKGTTVEVRLPALDE
jgi:two-component system, NtrC family, sensor kinase